LQRRKQFKKMNTSGEGNAPGIKENAEGEDAKEEWSF